MLLERGLGGAATVLLGAIGFGLAIGHYDIGAYLWLEGAFVLGTFVAARPLLRALGTARCCAAAGPLLRRPAPRAAAARLLRGRARLPLARRLLVGVFVFTLAMQAVRVLAIWAAAKAVGIDESPRLYYVMGPLFFLVLLVPFTLNGFAVREAFFVSFLAASACRPTRRSRRAFCSSS